MTNAKKSTKNESRATTILRGYCGRRRREPLAEMLGMSRTTILERINHPEDLKLSEIIMLMFAVGLGDDDLLEIVHDLKRRFSKGGRFGK